MGSTWKAVCFACLNADEFRLAATCGLEVIKYPDHVDDVVTYYSNLGHFIHLVSLFEQGLGLEDAHIGIFTELGVLYTKHVPEKVMEHAKFFLPSSTFPRLFGHANVPAYLDHLC